MKEGRKEGTKVGRKRKKGERKDKVEMSRTEGRRKLSNTEERKN